MTNYQEGIIPKAVWKFVKSLMKHPIKAGILALIISNFLSKSKPKSEGYESILESLDIKEKVVKRGNQYCVIHCSGKDAGKTIKCFPTEDKACAIHRAIQVNK